MWLSERYESMESRSAEALRDSVVDGVKVGSDGGGSTAVSAATLTCPGAEEETITVQVRVSALFATRSFCFLRFFMYAGNAERKGSGRDSQVVFLHFVAGPALTSQYFSSIVQRKRALRVSGPHRVGSGSQIRRSSVCNEFDTVKICRSP